jgi:anti-sigma regulatory factor (Ser/Thr protein kinase)
LRKFERSEFSRIELPALLDSLDQFRCFVLKKAGELSVDPEFLPNLELALEELLVNVISYAYPSGRAGMIEVGCGTFDGRMFCIQIRDHGKPFDPLTLPDPDITLDVLERPVGGLGIYFVRQLAELVRHEYIEDSNQLTCCFACLE